MSLEIPVQTINGEPLSEEQKRYLDGFFAGLAAQGVTFGDVQAMPVAGKKVSLDDLIFEERVKRELHPLDAYDQIVENAVNNKAPDKEDLFRFKWNGLFFLTPNKEAFMARLRIPGGSVKTFQLRELANIAKELTSGYVQVTTRANFQMRLILPKDCPEFLRRIQSVGLHTRGAGADNIRNITANPTAGIDPLELIDVMPLCQQLAQTIINDRSFYDLPRKFNIAYDGGGLIGTVEDTNDIGAKAVKVGDDIFFRIALGGATGHKTFARDLGVLVPPAELNKVILAIVRVYIANGNRGDRKKARLKHLLETWSLEKYLDETEKILGHKLTRVPLDPATVRYPAQEISHSHLGVYPQKQPGLNYIGAAMPVGQITPRQMIRVAEIADLYGSGEIRLTVWQNFIIPNVPDAYVETVKKALRKIGFDTKQSLLRGGLIACTGNAYCKFAQSDTKGHAASLADYLDKRVTLDTPINIHLTGCPNSCAQHYMGDIGLLGTKVRGEDGYHVFVGGGFGSSQAVGRQLFAGVSATSLNETLERLLKNYLRHRQGNETFRQFTGRHELGKLQELLGGNGD
ncbi:MAG TPA: NirA family protein [Desulfuromonadaceae bacterium]|nr:NirA family protein [Desulfuromonadaceae bacterium]